jgi:hypothetical protein
VRAIVATSALLLIAAVLPQAVAGQAFFDPGSPSDKEYAVPHDQARGGGTHGGGSGGGTPGGGSGGGTNGGGPSTPTSSGGSAGQGGSGPGAGSGGSPGDAQVFGQGISRASGHRAGDAGSATGKDGARTGVGTKSSVAVELTPASSRTDATTGLGWFIAIAAAVALAGAGLAYLIRSTTRRTAS